jgi:hypothetical protein
VCTAPPALPRPAQYLNYAVLIVFGHIRDFLAKLTGWSRYFNKATRPPPVRGLLGGRGAAGAEGSCVCLRACARVAGGVANAATVTRVG